MWGTRGYHPAGLQFAVMTGAVRTPQDQALDAVVSGTFNDPFAILGPHRDTRGGRPAMVVRTFQPLASRVEVITGDQAVPMVRLRREGLFEASVATDQQPHELQYRLRLYEGARVREVVDPYRYGQIISDFDLHLFGEGTHYRAWDTLGSHGLTLDGVQGVHFAVWAPNAQRVSVIGDFNRWDGRSHVMRRLVPSGVWEIFIPGLKDGDCYKYEIRTPAGHLLQKADPYGRRFEVPPNTASIIWTDGQYAWDDSNWMRDRAAAGGWHERPMSIYEVHLGSWR